VRFCAVRAQPSGQAALARQKFWVATYDNIFRDRSRAARSPRSKDAGEMRANGLKQYPGLGMELR